MKNENEWGKWEAKKAGEKENDNKLASCFSHLLFVG